METQDPFEWTISEVTTFLRHTLPHQVAIIPDTCLPDIDQLVQQFKRLKVNGDLLLYHITHDLLRDECRVVAFAERCSLLSAIRILRSQSPRYAAFANGTDTASAKFGFNQPHETVAAGQAIRKGEQLVEDATGRKRRRLALAPAQATLATEDRSGMLVDPGGVSETTTSTQALRAIETQAYLPPSKLDIDTVIYGNTQAGDAIPDNSLPSTSDDNGEFTVFNTRLQHAGVQHYVYSTMRHLMCSAETATVRFRGKSMTALYPYHKNLTPLGAHRSMTVFDTETDDAALRINESMVDREDGQETAPPERSGEWGFLLDKYKDDETLSAYHASDNEIDSSLADELSDDEKEPAKSKILSKTDVETIVGDFIETVAADWRDGKRPKLEVDKASRIWHRMKNSRTTRESLIAEAQERQQHLDTRLRKMRLDLESQEWSSASNLTRQCDILEPTIEDREEQGWIISVYKRSSPPEKARAVRSRTGRKHVPIDETTVPSCPPLDDVAGFVSDDDFQDAAAFPPADQIMSIDHARPHTDTSTTNNVAENGTLEDTADDDVTMRAWADAEDSDNSEQHVDDDAIKEDEPPSDPEEIDGYDELQVTQLSLKPDRDIEYLPSDDDDLSSPSIVLSQVIPRSSRQADIKQDSPLPGSNTAKRQSEVIEISSDDPEPRPKRLKKYKRPSLNPEPLEATREEIEDWPLEELARNGDRMRLLMGLLHSLPLARKDDLWNHWQSINSNPLTLASQIDGVRLQLIEEEQYPHLPTVAISEPLMDFFQLYACHYALTLKFWQDKPGLDDLNGMSLEDIEMWTHLLSIHFSRIHRLSMGDDRTGRNVGKTIIEISGESSNEPAHESLAEDETAKESETPRKKRRRIVEKDKTAEQTRTAAQDRLAIFQQQTSRNVNGSQLDSSQHDDNGNKDSIVINVIRAERDPAISLHPKLARRYKPHQVEAVQFMWREITAVGESGGQGCLLAHTMGLGKTASSIGLLVSLKQALENLATRRLVPDDIRPLHVLITSPPALIPNWIKELREWSPSPNFFTIWALESGKQEQRLATVEAWSEANNSILLVGHQMLTKLVKPPKQDHSTNDDLPINTINNVSYNSDANRVDSDKARMRKLILDKPTVVIADEAHAFKNAGAAVSEAVRQIRTQRRIALTGSPMSNNTGEIYSLISWIAPNYLGAADEFRSTFAIPIEEGSYRDSTRAEKRKSLKRLELLKDEIAPKVHRADITALRGALKTKVEYVLTVPLTELQEKLYIKCVECLRGPGGDKDITQIKLFNWLSLLTLLCNHPRSFRDKLQEKPPVKNAVQAKPTNEPSGTNSESSKDDDSEVVGDAHISTLGMTNAMIEDLVAQIPDSPSVELSRRMQLAREILQLSKKAGDKVLIFSHSLPTLNYMVDMLKEIGISYSRIDGSYTMARRERVLSEYNAPGSDTQVLLISTRAGGQGLNIQTANRVIILDYGFNPTWEEQAVGRAYRLGQTKPVYVYRFVAAGTHENQLYNMGIFKMSLAQRVVDKKNPARNADRKASEWLYPPKKVHQKDIRDEAGKDTLVLDRLIDRQVKGEDCFIRAITTMETLQAEADDEPLTEEEKKEIEAEKLARMRDREVLGTQRM